MRSIQVRGKAGADGVLRLSIPVGTAGAECEVVVVVQPQAPPAVHPDWPPGFFEQTAGAWQGELERAPQGEYDKREKL